jgi:hypothetical protein
VVLYEREPDGGSRWGETSDLDEDPPDWHDEARSYCLFFVSSTDDRLKFATDTIEPDEEGVERRFQGEGRIGYVVAISLVAPFAVVAQDQLEVFENGSRSESPTLSPTSSTSTGGRWIPRITIAKSSMRPGSRYSTASEPRSSVCSEDLPSP